MTEEFFLGDTTQLDAARERIRILEHAVSHKSSELESARKVIEAARALDKQERLEEGIPDLVTGLLPVSRALIDRLNDLHTALALQENHERS